MAEDNVDLKLLTQQNQRIINELATIRDTLDVLTAMSMRQENSIASLTSEVRVFFRFMNRTNDRLQKLETEHHG
jgi:hypothetical protein